MNARHPSWFPTIQEVEQMDREAVCHAWRFLRGPMSEEEIRTINRLAERLKELGGFTPAISKRLGWDCAVRTGDHVSAESHAYVLMFMEDERMLLSGPDFYGERYPTQDARGAWLLVSEGSGPSFEEACRAALDALGKAAPGWSAHLANKLDQRHGR